MLSQNRLLSCMLALIMAVALAACGRQGTPTAGPQANAPAAAAPAVLGDLKITSYGPDRTKAGVVFNVQPNGGSALWIRLNQSLDGYEAAVELNATLLQGNISGNLVTAGVPAALYAKPGTYSLRVIARRGARTERSNDVKFTVE